MAVEPCEDASYECCLSGEPCRFAAEIAQLRNQVAQLQSQVSTDALTQLHNYRYFAQVLPLEIERAQRNAQPLSLALLDIDHFKDFNDLHGHEAGNLALQAVAQRITQVLRKLDIACRYGGEEFALVLPHTRLAQAVVVAQRVCSAIANTPVEWQGEPLRISASVGVASFDLGGTMTAAQLVAKADEFLYQAKAQGRNQVCHAALGSMARNQSHVGADEKALLLSPFTGSDIDEEIS